MSGCKFGIISCVNASTCGQKPKQYDEADCMSFVRHLAPVKELIFAVIASAAVVVMVVALTDKLNEDLVFGQLVLLPC